MTLRDRVYTALNNAVLNSHDMVAMTADEIAVDLSTYNCDFEYVQATELLPIINEWKQQQEVQT